MADESACEGKHVEDLEKDITCAICQEYYTEPKVLPCLHYYCKLCILNLAHQSRDNKPFPCPVCRSETILPEGGVEELKTAFFVHHLKSAYTTVEQLHGKVEVKCEACNSECKANSFCRQCAMFICEICVESHQRMKGMFKGHELVSIQDLKEGKTKVGITLKESTAPSMKCSVHKKSLKLYCFDCNLLICQHCTLKDHRDHNFDFNVITAPKIKQELMDLLEPLIRESDSLSKAVDKVASAKDEIKAQGGHVINAIQLSFAEFLHKVNELKEELILKAEQEVEAKVKDISEQEKYLSMALVEVQSIVDYTERCVRHCDDNEVMGMHVEVKHRLERDAREQYTEKNTEPVHEADMGVEVRCTEALQQLYKSNITRLAINPARSRILGRGDLKAEVNETTEVIVVAKLTRSKSETSVTGQLKSLCDGSVVKCNMQQINHEKYQLKYTPIIRGHHELTVTVADGQHIAGSPFPVFVSIHPTKLGQPVKVWNDLHNVINVVINSKEEVLVLMQDEDILSVYKNGEKIRYFSRNDLQLDNCQVAGLDVDEEDNIYITAFGSKTMLKLSKDGNIIKKIKIEGTCYGVTVMENNILLCSYKAVLVYSRELEYVKTISCEDAGQLFFLSNNSNGDLYITDGDRNCIQVYSHLGDFLNIFTSNDNETNAFTWPLGVRVKDQFVYISNSGGKCHNIFVLTTDGEHVTTFGNYGDEEGAFNLPRGVYLDRHGFVYVCDKHNNRIQIF